MPLKLVVALVAALAFPASASAGFAEPDTVLWQQSGEDGAYFGWAVSELADIDGDGAQEVIVGEPFARNGADGTTWGLSDRTGARTYELPCEHNTNPAAAVA